MWYFILLGLALVAVVVGALAMERRRRGLGEDAREDRFVNPTRHQSWVEKQSGHGGTNA